MQVLASYAAIPWSFQRFARKTCRSGDVHVIGRGCVPPSGAAHSCGPRDQRHGRVGGDTQPRPIIYISPCRLTRVRAVFRVNAQFATIIFCKPICLLYKSLKARPSASLASLRSISIRTWYQFLLMACDQHVMILFEECQFWCLRNYPVSKFWSTCKILTSFSQY